LAKVGFGNQLAVCDHTEASCKGLLPKVRPQNVAANILASF
jgi:hypothetical protein